MNTEQSPQHDPLRAATEDRNNRSASRKAGWFWGTLIVGLLATQVVVGVGAVVIATADPSVSIVPDYHQKALRWDDEMATRAASHALGWEARVAVSGGTDQLGNRTLVVTLQDRDSDPVEAAGVQVRLFHHARASEPQSIELREQGLGHYTGTASMDRNGLWQVDLSAKRSQSDSSTTEEFVSSQTLELSSDGTEAIGFRESLETRLQDGRASNP